MIDERIVSLELRNKGLMEKAEESIKEIDKLKKALKFSGSSGDMSDVADALGEDSLAQVEKSVDRLSQKFSGLGLVGTVALTNIANKAVNASARIAKEFFLAPITGGFGKYESMLNTQAAMQSSKYFDPETGALMEHPFDDIQKTLQSLSEYSDETSYSFTTMSSALSQMLSVGRALPGLDKTVKGIASSAALAGIGVDKANELFPIFSQIAAKGFMGRDEYNRLVQRNYMTPEFRRGLLEEAASRGDNIVKENGKYYYKHKKGKKVVKEEINEGNFMNYLKDGIITFDIIDSVLKRFGDYIEGGLSREELIDRLVKVGYDAEKLQDLTDDELELLRKQTAGNRGYYAAQNANTWQDVTRALKDAASSRWMATWEQIFGNINQAREFFTPLANDLIMMSDRLFHDNRLEGFTLWNEKYGGGDTLRKGILGIIEGFTGKYDKDYNLISEGLFPAIGEAFNQGLGIGSPEEVAEKLKVISDAVANFADRFRNWLDGKDALGVTRLQKISAIFRGLGKVLGVVLKIGGKLVSIIFKIAAAIGVPILNFIIDVLGYIVIGLRGIYEWGKDIFAKLKDAKVFETLLALIRLGVTKLLDKVKEFFRSIRESQAVQNLKDSFERLKKTIIDFVDKAKGKIETFKKVFDELGKDDTISTWERINRALAATGETGEKISNVSEKLRLNWIKLEGVIANSRIGRFLGQFGRDFDNSLNMDTSDGETLLDKIKKRLGAFNPTKNLFEEYVVKPIREALFGYDRTDLVDGVNGKGGKVTVHIDGFIDKAVKYFEELKEKFKKKFPKTYAALVKVKAWVEKFSARVRGIFTKIRNLFMGFDEEGENGRHVYGLIDYLKNYDFQGALQLLKNFFNDNIINPIRRFLFGYDVNIDSFGQAQHVNGLLDNVSNFFANLKEKFKEKFPTVYKALASVWNFIKNFDIKKVWHDIVEFFNNLFNPGGDLDVEEVIDPSKWPINGGSGGGGNGGIFGSIIGALGSVFGISSANADELEKTEDGAKKEGTMLTRALGFIQEQAGTVATMVGDFAGTAGGKLLEKVSQVATVVLGVGLITAVLGHISHNLVGQVGEVLGGVAKMLLAAAVFMLVVNNIPDDGIAKAERVLWTLGGFIAGVIGLSWLSNLANSALIKKYNLASLDSNVSSFMNPVTKTLKTLGGSIAAIAAAIYLFGKIDDAVFTKGAQRVNVLIGSLLGLAAILVTVDMFLSTKLPRIESGKVASSLGNLTGLIKAIAIAVLAVAASMILLNFVSDKAFKRGIWLFVVVAGLLTLMFGAIAAISAFGKREVSDKMFDKIAKVIWAAVALMAAVAGLLIVISMISITNPAALGWFIGIMAVIAVAIVAIGLFADKMANLNPVTMAKAGASLGAFVAAAGLVISAAILLASLVLDVASNSLNKAGAALWSFGDDLGKFQDQISGVSVPLVKDALSILGEIVKNVKDVTDDHIRILRGIGESLWAYGSYLGSFSTSIKDFDKEKSLGSIEFAKEFAGMLPIIEEQQSRFGIVREFGVVMTDFAADIAMFNTIIPDEKDDKTAYAATLAGNLRDAANALNGLTVDPEFPRVFGAMMTDFASSAGMFNDLIPTESNDKTGYGKTVAENLRDTANALNGVTVSDNLPGRLTLIAGAMSVFGTALSDGSIDPSKFATAEDVVAALGKIRDCIPDEATVNTVAAYAAGGDKDGAMGAFAAGIGAIGLALSDYSKHIKDLTSDDVKRTGDFLGVFIALSNGLTQDRLALIDHFGNSTSIIGEFANDLPQLGVGISKFATELKELTFKDIDKTEAFLGIFTSLSRDLTEDRLKLIDKMPKGQSIIQEFANDLIQLGGGVQQFAAGIRGLTSEDVENTGNLLNILVKLESELSKQRMKDWLGNPLPADFNIDTFGSELTLLGTGIRDFLDGLHQGGINNVDVDDVDNLFKVLERLNDNVHKNAGWIGRLFGDTALTEFAHGVSKLGTGIKDFTNALVVDGKAVDLEAGQKAADIFATIIGAFSSYELGAIEEATVNYGSSNALAQANRFIFNFASDMESFGDAMNALGGGLNEFMKFGRDVKASDIPKKGTQPLWLQYILAVTDQLVTLQNSAFVQQLNTEVITGKTALGANIKKKLVNFIHDNVQPIADIGADLKTFYDSASKLRALPVSKDTKQPQWAEFLKQTVDGLNYAVLDSSGKSTVYTKSGDLVTFAENMVKFSGSLSQFYADITQDKYDHPTDTIPILNLLKEFNTNSVQDMIDEWSWEGENTKGAQLVHNIAGTFKAATDQVKQHLSEKGAGYVDMYNAGFNAMAAFKAGMELGLGDSDKKTLNGNKLTDAMQEQIDDLVGDALVASLNLTPVIDWDSMDQSDFEKARAGFAKLLGLDNLNSTTHAMTISSVQGTVETHDSQIVSLTAAVRNVQTEVGNLGRDIAQMKIVLDSGVLVGQLSAGIDSRIGYEAWLRGRSVTSGFSGT